MIEKNKDQFLSYLEDTSNLKGNAQKVYIPQNKDELDSCLKSLVDKRMPVTLSGGRTGTTGGCVPLSGAVISLEALNRVISVDQREKTIHVEAGATLEHIENQANKHGLSLRAASTECLAFIGGAISTCASGVRGFGYGSIRNYIKRLDLILTGGQKLSIGRGEVFSKGRKFDFESGKQRFSFKLPGYITPGLKSQAGYFVSDDMDLIDLFIGSEGTLAVIYSAEISLQPYPAYVFDGLIFYPSQELAFELISRLKDKAAGRLISPVSLEFFDQNSLRFLRTKFPYLPSADAAVYFEQEVSKEKAEESFQSWQDLLIDSGALIDDSILAESQNERKRVFDIRHSLPQLINEFLRTKKQLKVSSDIAVPDEHFLEMYSFYKQSAKESNIDYVNFGHAGESHLHFNFLPKNDQEYSLARKYMIEFAKKAVSLSGTISAEHGIGKLKKPYLRFMHSQEAIKEMAALKKYFDPYCLLGLDNIFDKELLSRV
ncbi:MAG: FAD-binding oxidoreductase [Candidatus Omnitrophica bacterium]|nr:FAD-binding oxidoreductase [Candidatus Omnitrophota bacterium]